jgi:hypothetical protein
MKPNPGHLPHEAIGKRVRVRLARDPRGKVSFEAHADSRGAVTWELRGWRFDIAEYEVVT